MVFVERYHDILGKVHITRILGTNKAGDILPDIWADVERVENFTVVTQLAGQYQKIVYKFRWRDDPDEEYYRAEDDISEDENLTSTETIILKVCSPDESDLNDPVEWIPVRVIKRLRMLEGGEGGMASKNFLSDQLTKDLGVRLRRIYHYDTSMDDKAGAAFADPTRKAYVERAYLYAKDDETKDEGQYIECEIVTHILKYENAHESYSGADQKVYVNFKNQYLIDESEPAKLEKLGNQDKNPPYRLDPFQNIINCQFAFNVIVVFVDLDNSFKSTFDVIGDKANQLDQYDLDVGFVNPAWITVFKVGAGAGEFVTVTTSSVIQPGDAGFGNQVGRQSGCYVFAMDGAIDDSLARAKSGIGSIIRAHWGNGGASTAPPGLIWSAGSNHWPPGNTTNWKIQNVNHRDDTNPDNKMVQCYPLSHSWTMAPIAITYTGYWVFIYRLDKKGTGPVYGTTDLITSDLSKVSVDPAWHQQISSAGNNDSINYGIPFGDPPPPPPDKPPDLSGPPPLINTDIKSFPYPDTALTRVDNPA